MSYSIVQALLLCSRNRKGNQVVPSAYPDELLQKECLTYYRSRNRMRVPATVVTSHLLKLVQYNIKYYSSAVQLDRSLTKVLTRVHGRLTLKCEFQNASDPSFPVAAPP